MRVARNEQKLRSRAIRMSDTSRGLSICVFGRRIRSRRVLRVYRGVADLVELKQ